MPFLIIFGLVIVGFVIAFIVAIIKGVGQGIKRVNQINNLQNNADSSYTTKNGPFTFKYAFKKFVEEKKLIIIIVPELPLSAWKPNMVYDNQGLEAEVKVSETICNTSLTKTIKMQKLEQRLEVELEEKMLNCNLNVNVKSKWLFEDKELLEEINIVMEAN